MGASLPNGASRRQPEPEINITPLVDVMLVLLIIFMVITPTLAEGADIQLPAMTSVDAKPKDLEPIDVALLRDGSVMLNKSPIPAASLEARLRTLHAADEKKRVMLKADTQVLYKRVRETFALLQTVGFHGVALRVTKRDSKLGTPEMAFAVGGPEKGKPRPKPAINVTPLVDVILVVLIIFMMVVPMMMKTFWLNVPKAAEQNKEEKLEEPQDADEAKKPLVMTVDKNGVIMVNRHMIPRKELAVRLPRMLAAKENKVLYFDADDDAPYGIAASVMDAARAAGAVSIAIMAQKISR